MVVKYLISATHSVASGYSSEGQYWETSFAQIQEQKSRKASQKLAFAGMTKQVSSEIVSKYRKRMARFAGHEDFNNMVYLEVNSV
jgi:hypothetical protein